MPARKATKYIVVHCSATPPNMDVGVKEITQWHIKRGFNTIGYHFVIRRNGVIEKGREVNQIGAHVSGYNSVSVGVCLVGGVAVGTGRAQNNFTTVQFQQLRGLLNNLKKQFPSAKIVGHRDLSPDTNGDGIISKYEWLKDCPSFEISDFVKEHAL